MKLHDAYFFNDDRSIVRTIWHDNDSKEIIRDIPAQEDNAQYRKFMVEMNKAGGIDALHERTYEYLKDTQENFENQVVEIAKRKGLWGEIIDNDNRVLMKLADFIMYDQKQIDNKSLFKFKLALFEKDIVKNSTDRKAKAGLRKAESYYDAIIAYRKFKK
jgi:hypothetical protein|tara:strand:+ start:192 stop:671 length:480 start_codon:yes stop_codon:yes gene_type:complete